MSTPVHQRRGYRPEIEGLRAVAALLVAVYHIWVGRVSGGVDVFFVVSGLLITTTLLGQLDRFGRVRPLLFLGRLVRRLLPSALIVLLATLIMTWTLLPEALRARSLREIAASALYAENWHLAFAAVDYLDRDDPATPVQHFWAMSVQGQFYLLWAVVFLGAWLLARHAARKAAFAIIAALTVLTIGYSVWFTAVNQPFAYFSTFTRVWEFGLGALVAFFLVRVTLPRTAALVLGWLGLAAIVLCGAVLPVGESFPGAVALIPVGAALLILFSGVGRDQPGHATWLLARRPLVWLGGFSYGIYLWHWPLLVIFRDLTGTPDVGILPGVTIIALSIVLSWLTTRLVERPIRSAGDGSPRRRLVTSIALIATAAVLAGGAVVSADRVSHAAADRQQEIVERAEASGCFGAGAIVDDDGCTPSDPDALVPDRAGLREDTAGAYGCYAGTEDTDAVSCRLGSESDDALRIAIVGNSHAAMLVAGLRDQLDERDWMLDTFVGNGCVWGLPSDIDRCVTRQAQVEESLFDGEPYDVLIATNPGPTDDVGEEAADAFEASWRLLAEERGTQVIVVEDNPRLGEEAASCVIASSAEDLVAGACDVGEADGYAPADMMWEAAQRPGSDAESIGMRDLYCADGVCPAVIGDVIVYRDEHHLTGTYATTVAPYLADRIDAALAAAR